MARVVKIPDTIDGRHSYALLLDKAEIRVVAELSGNVCGPPREFFQRRVSDHVYHACEAAGIELRNSWFEGDVRCLSTADCYKDLKEL